MKNNAIWRPPWVATIPEVNTPVRSVCASSAGAAARCTRVNCRLGRYDAKLRGLHNRAHMPVLPL